ncbi:MAG: hypothetical protein BWY83_00601 [bacterium ADurb.Bin478]|nr:MAG: hypothetical protein BWY83_00601 [bacterium ADurb.Bin478]
MGVENRSKNSPPTEIFSPRSHSLRLGMMVPMNTPMVSAMNSRLLMRKLDSLELQASMPLPPANRGAR